MLAPVLVVAVASAVAMPLVLAHPDAHAKSTGQSAEAVNALRTVSMSVPIEAELTRRSYVAAASRSATRTALAARLHAAQAEHEAQVQAARERAAAEARALATSRAKARKELRLQQIKAAALLLQRQAQAREQFRLQQIKVAADLLHQRQLQAVAAQKLVATRAAQARATQLTTKSSFKAASLGSPKAYAQSLIGSGKQYGCLVLLWNRESGWNYRANNPSSSAYGIPQALPGSKMASAGADWRTNPATQIRWGLGYIRARYGTPCGAWAHSQSSGWY
jgi:murein DD-endopeptidase MepM/ murein hydrolase activator NlpD